MCMCVYLCWVFTTDIHLVYYLILLTNVFIHIDIFASLTKGNIYHLFSMSVCYNDKTTHVLVCASVYSCSIPQILCRIFYTFRQTVSSRFLTDIMCHRHTVDR